MKPATQYFIKAIVWEFLLASITFNIANSLVFKIIPVLVGNLYLLTGFIVALVPLTPLIFLLGKVNYTKMGKVFRRCLGVILQFLFLTLAVSVACCLILIVEGENIHQISKIALVVLYFFYIFGGIQTLLIGIWLGKKLSEIE